MNQSPGFNTHKPAVFGARLKTAREALGIDCKEVAAQLRLHENMIMMMEHGEYKTDIPMTFIRGYVRSYSKLLGIPEKEVHEIMESMQPKQNTNEDLAFAHLHTKAENPDFLSKHFPLIDIGNASKQLFNCLLVIALIVLVAAWWHTHKTNLNKATQATSLDLPTETPTTTQPDYSALRNPEANTPVNTQPEPSIVVPQPMPVTKAPIAIKHQDKNLYTQLINLNRSTQILMSLILFLIIITASMRIYASPTKTGMASLRNKPGIRKNSGVRFNSLFKIKPPSKLRLASLTASLIALSGVIFWYEYGNKHFTTPTTKPVIAEVKSETINPLLLNTDFANLKTPDTLMTVFMSSIKPYVLQDMAYQLDQYLADAKATRFALTDKSTPIGQWRGRKRRYRTPYYTNRNYYNQQQQRQQYNNNAPPYYYVQ